VSQPVYSAQPKTSTSSIPAAGLSPVCGLRLAMNQALICEFNRVQNMHAVRMSYVASQWHGRRTEHICSLCCICKTPPVSPSGLMCCKWCSIQTYASKCDDHRHGVCSTRPLHTLSCIASRMSSPSDSLTLALRDTIASSYLQLQGNKSVC